MFILWVEYCLIFCEDNVDLCFIEKGCELGFVDDWCWVVFEVKCEGIECEEQWLKSIWVWLNILQGDVIVECFGMLLIYEYNLFNLLSCFEIDYVGLVEIIGDVVDNFQVVEQVEICIKYVGYIDCQQEEIVWLCVSEDICLFVDIDYLGIFGLLKEIQNKLNQVCLEIFGQVL